MLHLLQYLYSTQNMSPDMVINVPQLALNPARIDVLGLGFTKIYDFLADLAVKFLIFVVEVVLVSFANTVADVLPFLLIGVVGAVLFLFAYLISRATQYLIKFVCVNLNHTIDLLLNTLVTVVSGAFVFVFVLFTGMVLKIHVIVRCVFIITYAVCIATEYVSGGFSPQLKFDNLALGVQYRALPYALNATRHLPGSYRPFVAKVWGSVLAESLNGKRIEIIDRVIAAIKNMHNETAESGYIQGVYQGDTELLLETVTSSNVFCKADWRWDMINVRDAMCPRK